MNLRDAETQVAALIAQLALAVETEQEARRTIAGLAKILDGYREMFPELKDQVEDAIFQVPTHPVDEPERPRGAEAVRLILQESPGEWFRVSELLPLLRDRGWLPESENPANAVRAALERLVANGDESDVIRGKWANSGAVGYKYDPDRDRDPASPSSEGGGYGFDEEPF